MIYWRISRHRDLSGIGGLRAGGRWHHPGQPVVYLSESPASTLLEVCVHTTANDIPPEFTLLRIEAPDSEVPAIREDTLPKGWQLRLDVTRSLGTEWLRKKEDVLLGVPSAIVPRTTNFLLNPLHSKADQFRIVEVLNYPFDGWLKG